MTRAEFDPVSAFLESRRGRLNPFFVILPQHAAPKDATFAAYATANPTLITASTTSAGSPTLMLNGFTAVAGSPSPGDFFTITDGTDVNHRKAYKVLRVEDNDTYQTGSIRPTLNTQRRVWTQPPITRAVTSGAVVNFINPRFRVVQKGDTMEYDLSTDNLYQFSLSLEEILP